MAHAIYSSQSVKKVAFCHFFDSLKGPQGPFLFSARLFHVEQFLAFIFLFHVEHQPIIVYSI